MPLYEGEPEDKANAFNAISYARSLISPNSVTARATREAYDKEIARQDAIAEREPQDEFTIGSSGRNKVLERIILDVKSNPHTSGLVGLIGQIKRKVILCDEDSDEREFGIIAIAYSVIRRVVEDNINRKYQEFLTKKIQKKAEKEMSGVYGNANSYDPENIGSLDELKTAILESPSLGPHEASRYIECIDSVQEHMVKISKMAATEVKSNPEEEKAIFSLGQGKVFDDYWATPLGY